MDRVKLTARDALEELLPLLRKETPLAYLRFRDQITFRKKSAPVHDLFDQWIPNPFIEELFERSKRRIAAKDKLLMAVLCAFKAEEYEVMLHLKHLYTHYTVEEDENTV